MSICQWASLYIYISIHGNIYTHSREYRVLETGIGLGRGNSEVGTGLVLRRGIQYLVGRDWAGDKDSRGRVWGWAGRVIPEEGIIGAGWGEGFQKKDIIGAGWGEGFQKKVL